MQKIINFFWHVHRGMGWLPAVGEHPGNLPLAMFLGCGALTGLAGKTGGIAGAVFGLCIVAIVYGPVWIYGCYERSQESMRWAKKYPNLAEAERQNHEEIP